MYNEVEIVTQAINGNIKAFERIVKQYEKLVFSILNKLLNQNNEDIEDVSQEVFLKVYKHLKTFQFQSKLATWIARITYLTALNYIKKNGKHQHSIHYPTDLEHWHFTNETPEQLLEAKDTADYIAKLMDQMPLHYKTVLTLYHLHEFSYDEMVQTTGLPEGTIKGYLFRARKLLKEKMDLFNPKKEI